MSIYRVYNACYHAADAPGQCFHWCCLEFGGAPYLCSSISIQDKVINKNDCSDDHFVSRMKTRSRGCGNPWNYFSEAEANIIRNQKPKPEYSPIFPFRLNYSTELVDESDIINVLRDYVFADCWGIYKRTRDTHETERVYYSFRNNKPKPHAQMLPEHEQEVLPDDFPEPRNNYPPSACFDTRDALSLRQIVEDLQESEELCLVMNQYFMEVCIVRVGTKFLVIAIHYSR